MKVFITIVSIANAATYFIEARGILCELLYIFPIRVHLAVEIPAIFC
jgi:hypothetical protein